MDIQGALELVHQHDADAGDGKWLETLTASCGPKIREWDLKGCWPWEDWPDRVVNLPDSRPNDDGIDVVGQRRDGRFIAIQCKAKGRDPGGKRYNVTKDDVTDFVSASLSPLWVERWIVTDGELSGSVRQRTGPLGDGSIKHISILQSLLAQQASDASADEETDDPRTAMQNDAVSFITQRLENIRGERHEGWKDDEARGYVVMPCGTGKTRVGFRVAADMTQGQGLIVVLAPSIGLVAQLRREWLSLADGSDLPISVLAVCSDVTAAHGKVGRHNEDDESLEKDPTLDRSHVSDRNFAGEVARNADEVRNWLERTKNEIGLRVIVSTYQSGHQTAEGLRNAGARADLMIGDEAHRTAGIRRVSGKKREERLRQFTMCHDSDDFPARTRLYMTATPRVYSLDKPVDDSRWEVRTMDDERTFGVECYRLSYTRAVEEGLLSDYRIIALGIPENAIEPANRMADDRNRQHREAGRPETSTPTLALRKLAYGLAIAGGLPPSEDGSVVSLHSSIAFCNRIQNSSEMAEELDNEHVRNWIAAQMQEQGQSPRPFKVVHRDAGHGSSAREEALDRLAHAKPDMPYAITNVGIFGEGTDSPGLTAVAFIEPRRSPVDVVQAVGRVMRRSPDKKLGYIIVPIEIPRGRHAETWLESTTAADEGWKELGQILNALRAHDDRIENRLADLMQFYLPQEPADATDHLVAIQSRSGVKTYIYSGSADDIEPALIVPATGTVESAATALENSGNLREITRDDRLTERPRSAHVIDDRRPRHRRLGPVDLDVAWQIDNGGYDPAPAIQMTEDVLHEVIRKPKRTTTRMRKPKRRRARTKPAPVNPGLRLLSGLDDANGSGGRIVLNILERSGIAAGPKRDMNVLQNTVSAAASLLRGDGLEEPLKRQLRMERLRQGQGGNSRADACTVTALLVTNAALMHVRLARASAIGGLVSVAEVAASDRPAEALMAAWNAILNRDYQPIFSRARDLLQFLTRDERKTAALGAAIRRIAKDAELIADTYAEMGMDHAGELFNKVMGDQSSDGAYFTRPLAATLLAELALHATGEDAWSEQATYDRLSMFDPACGSGTLLVAYLSGLKRRYKAAGSDERQLRRLHRKGVEQLVSGLDINQISLQLAGAQLSLGDASVRYRRMGLYDMPYGDGEDSETTETMLNHLSRAGSLELLTDSRIIGGNEAGPPDQPVMKELNRHHTRSQGRRVALEADEQDDLDDLVEAIEGCRVALMNPPFVARTKLCERFADEERTRILARIDAIQDLLETTDPDMKGITDRNTTGPLYVALGLKAIDQERGVLGMVVPTAGLLAPSGRVERQILARELHVRWVVTCHEPGNTHMSQSTGINESLVIGTKVRQRLSEGCTFVSLDRLPQNEAQVIELCAAIVAGEDVPAGRSVTVSQEQMETGDWSACGWRNPALADDVAYAVAASPYLMPMQEIDGVDMMAVGGGFLSKFEQCARFEGDAGVLKSKGMDGQMRIRGRLDADIRLKPLPEETEDERASRAVDTLQGYESNRGYLLITAGQRNDGAKVCAVATDEPQLGTTWMPVSGIDRVTARAWAVWLNSTIGRICLLKHRGRTLEYPIYRPAGIRHIPFPDPAYDAAIETLAEAWDDTQDQEVPSYREGRVTVRERWDDAVAEALEFDRDMIARWADILNSEPYISREGFEDSLATDMSRQH